MLHSKIIKRENIDNIFTILSQEYENAGGNHAIDIFLVGGAAIVLDFSYRLSTIDIDALYEDDEKLDEAIKNASLKLSLPSDWLNHDFKNTPSYSTKIKEKARLISYYGKYIRLHTLDPKYLIAMKLKSSRPTGGDLDDVIMMIYELRLKNIPITYEEIVEAYKSLYPDFSNTYDYFLDKAKEAFKTPIEDFEYLFKKGI